jgi:NAD(P)-dependent dehydrogenase (short-subunit alcohol dehydrogenase family)
MLLANRVAIITGGAKGIGKGMALKFAEEGCAVAVVDINLNEAKATVKEIKNKGAQGLAVQCDVTVEKQVKAAVAAVVAKFGKVDILINNAGGAGQSFPIEDMPEEVWDRTFALNLKSQFFFSKYVVPLMKAARYGKIINLSSIGAVQPPMHHIAYNSAKAAAIGFTTDLANALAPFNINVNVLIPGPIRTNFYDGTIGEKSDAEKDAFFDRLGHKVPLQRVGTPQDMGNAALFLASEMGSFVSAHTLYITGGLPLLPPMPAAK